MKIKIFPLNNEQKFFILNLLTGLIAGIVAIFFHQSIHWLMHLFGTDIGFSFKSYIYGGLSLLAASFFTTRYMPVLTGSGIPRTKILLSVHHGIITTKEWVLKIIVTVLSLASGVPLGSEGPTVAITAGIGSTLGRKFRLNEKQVKSLVYAGCSAGIAAAFNTPIAAVIFTMEEIIGSSNTKSLGPILISSLIASVTAAALIGQNSVFTPVHYSFQGSTELIFYLVLGVVAGVAGPLLIKSIIALKKVTRWYFKSHRLTLIVTAFLLVGLLSQFFPSVPGNGLNIINNLLQGNIDSLEILSLLLVTKFLAIAICYGAGISGGILMPVLLLGAMLGGVFGSISFLWLDISQVEIGAYCLVGMGAFFASVMKTPFTSVILVFEMTRDYRIILPLMLACMCAYIISEWLSKGTLYEKVAFFEGYELPGHDEEDILSSHTVEDVFKKCPTFSEKEIPYQRFIYPDNSLALALTKIKRIGVSETLKVVNRLNTHEVIGEISFKDIFDFLAIDPDVKKSNAETSTTTLIDNP